MNKHKITLHTSSESFNGISIGLTILLWSVEKYTKETTIPNISLLKTHKLLIFDYTLFEQNKNPLLPKI